jgi:hypothetical protein
MDMRNTPFFEVLNSIKRCKKQITVFGCNKKFTKCTLLKNIFKGYKKLSRKLTLIVILENSVQKFAPCSSTRAKKNSLIQLKNVFNKILLLFSRLRPEIFLKAETLLSYFFTGLP